MAPERDCDPALVDVRCGRGLRDVLCDRCGRYVEHVHHCEPIGIADGSVGDDKILSDRECLVYLRLLLKMFRSDEIDQSTQSR